MRVQISGPAVSDWIPPGTLFGTNDYTPERIAAMRRVEQLGSQLAAEYPEIADLYRDVAGGPTCVEIARRFIPQEAARFPEVAEKAVIFALGLLLPADERKVITYERRRKQMCSQWDFESEEFRNHCSAASRVRHEKHGVDVEAMLLGRGRFGWTRAEKHLLVELALSSQFHNTSGYADYERIALHLNDLFHEGRRVRYENSCRSMMADVRRNKRRGH